MKYQFTKAVKHQAKLRLALVGPAGSGKTYTALAIATTLVPGGRVALIDTEHGSASKYADLFDFDVLELSSFSPDTYVDAIESAQAAKYDVIVIDSLSHAWMGKDGALEIVDRESSKNPHANSFVAWRKVTPKHNALVESMISAKAHIVVTMRVKTEYVMVESTGKNGKKTMVPQKVGLAPIQRDGLEYEFDIVADMDRDNVMTVADKSRCPAIKGAVIEQPGENVSLVLREWLNGAPVKVEVASNVQPVNDTAPAVESEPEESVPMQRFRALSREITEAKGYAALLTLGPRVNAASQHTGIPEAQRRHLKELYTALLDEAQQLEQEAA